MVYSVLVFLAKASLPFVVFGFLMLNWGHTANKNTSWFKWVFCFKALETIQLKLREVKSTKDRIYNFFEYFVFCVNVILGVLPYALLYIGAFGILLNLFINTKN